MADQGRGAERIELVEALLEARPEEIETILERLMRINIDAGGSERIAPEPRTRMVRYAATIPGAVLPNQVAGAPCLIPWRDAEAMHEKGLLAIALAEKADLTWTRGGFKVEGVKDGRRVMTTVKSARLETADSTFGEAGLHSRWTEKGGGLDS